MFTIVARVILVTLAAVRVRTTSDTQSLVLTGIYSENKMYLFNNGTAFNTFDISHFKETIPGRMYNQQILCEMNDIHF